MIVISEFNIELTMLSRRPLSTSRASVQTMLTRTTSTVSMTQRSQTNASMIAIPNNGSQLTQFSSAINANRRTSCH